MNHIENMGCLTSLVFTESGIDYINTNNFGPFQINAIRLWNSQLVQKIAS